MRIFITDGEFIMGKSGHGLRCTVNLGNGDYVWSIRGCLAFRGKKGRVRFLPPIVYIGPKRVRYQNNELSPKLLAMVEDAIEQEYGRHLKRVESERVRMGTPVSRFDPSLQESIEIVTVG